MFFCARFCVCVIIMRLDGDNFTQHCVLTALSLSGSVSGKMGALSSVYHGGQQRVLFNGPAAVQQVHARHTSLLVRL